MSDVNIDIRNLCRLARLDDVHRNVRKSTKLPIAAGPGQGKNVAVSCRDHGVGLREHGLFLDYQDMIMAY